VSKQSQETRIIACKRCGIHTRHERQEWVQRPLPLLLFTGRVKLISAWACKVRPPAVCYGTVCVGGGYLTSGKTAASGQTIVVSPW